MSQFVIGFQYKSGYRNGIYTQKQAAALSKCGDPKNCTFPNTLYHDMIDVNVLHWFPMRIRNSSLPRLTLMLQRLEMQKQQFEKDHITLDAYAPMRFIKSKDPQLR